jgi:hypothetical protein
VRLRFGSRTLSILLPVLLGLAALAQEPGRGLSGAAVVGLPTEVLLSRLALTDDERAALDRVAEGLREDRESEALTAWKHFLQARPARRGDLEPMVAYVLRVAFVEPDPELRRVAGRGFEEEEEEEEEENATPESLRRALSSEIERARAARAMAIASGGTATFSPAHTALAEEIRGEEADDAPRSLFQRAGPAWTVDQIERYLAGLEKELAELPAPMKDAARPPARPGASLSRDEKLRLMDRARDRLLDATPEGWPRPSTR